MFKIVIVMVMFSIAAFSQTIPGLGGGKIDKKQIRTTLIQLNKMGKVSDADLKKALTELDGYSQNEVDSLVKKGSAMAKKQLESLKKNEKKKQ